MPRTKRLTSKTVAHTANLDAPACVAHRPVSKLDAKDVPTKANKMRVLCLAFDRNPHLHK